MSTLAVETSKLADLDRLFAQLKEEKGQLEIVFAIAGTAKYAPLRQDPRNSLTRSLART